MRSIKALCLATALFTTAPQSLNAASSTADWVREDAELIASRMIAACRRNPDLLSRAATPAPLTDADAFRRACGEGLSRLPLPTEEWKFAFLDQGFPDGRIESLGVAKSLQLAGEEYFLIIGKTFKTYYPHEKRAVHESYASVDLFKAEPGRNQRVWGYLDSASAGPVLPKGQVKGGAPDGARNFIYEVWNQHALKNFRDFASSQRRSRGTLLGGE